MAFAVPKHSLARSAAVTAYRAKLTTANAALTLARSEFTEYKLDAAHYYIDRFKQLTVAGGAFTDQDARFELNLTLDSILGQMTGVRDALLQEINTALQLGIPDNEVEIGKVSPKAKAKGARGTVDPINKAMRYGNWLWEINEHRNQTHHRFTVGVVVNEAPVSGGQTPPGHEHLRFQRPIVMPGSAPGSPPKVRTHTRDELVTHLDTGWTSLVQLVEAVYEVLTPLV